MANEKEIAEAIVDSRTSTERPPAFHPLALSPTESATLWVPADITSKEIENLWSQLANLRAFLQSGADVRDAT